MSFREFGRQKDLQSEARIRENEFQKSMIMTEKKTLRRLVLKTNHKLKEKP